MITDTTGVPVNEGDLVALDIGFAIGRVVKIETGALAIARSPIVDGKIEAAQAQPFAVIEIIEHRAILHGQIVRVVKTAAQPAPPEASGILEQA